MPHSRKRIASVNQPPAFADRVGIYIEDYVWPQDTVDKLCKGLAKAGLSMTKP
jgi:hypothetical protein